MGGELVASRCIPSVPGFRFTPTGLLIDGDPTYDEWQGAGLFLSQALGAVHWWIGDWLNYGEARYGEMYAQALDDTRFDYGTLANDKWVAGRIESSRRHENLSFSHHQAVAKLETGEQDEWLAWAEGQQATRAELRKAISNGDDPATDPSPRMPDWIPTFEELFYIVQAMCENAREKVRAFLLDACEPGADFESLKHKHKL